MIEGEAKELKRGQGALGRLFGGLPEGSAAPAGTSTRARGNSSASQRARGEPSQAQRRRQEGVERLEEEDDRDSVLAKSERTDAVELDDVDGLSKYGGSTYGGRSREEVEDDDDFGDFEKATDARRVDPSTLDHEDSSRRT